MIDFNKVTTDRRNFLKLSIIAILSFAFASYLPRQSSEKKFNNLDEEDIKIIQTFNKKRLYSLENNIKDEIKKDLKNNRTVFLEKNLYTYAEIYLHSN